MASDPKELNDACAADTNRTLADVAKRLDPDGKIAMIVEIRTNEALRRHAID